MFFFLQFFFHDKGDQSIIDQYALPYLDLFMQDG